MSNLVIGGSKTLANMTSRYDTLASNHGVRIIKDMVASIDPAKKIAVLASGPSIADASPDAAYI
jgi:sulfide dehydrogenase [flavocytochrome c] flavoprotein chain